MRRLPANLLIATVCVLFSFSGHANAEQWPTRVVKFVVPFSAGGTTDILGRLMAQRLSEEYGQQVVVENKGGAGGNIGPDAVATAAPDSDARPKRHPIW